MGLEDMHLVDSGCTFVLGQYLSAPPDGLRPGLVQVFGPSTIISATRPHMQSTNPAQSTLAAGTEHQQLPSPPSQFP